MSKRFTFADAKLKIKELEGKISDLEGVLKDEFDEAAEDIAKDIKSFGYGDIVIAIAGAIVGFILGWIFV